MKYHHVIWTHDIIPGACALSGMTGFEDDWKLLYGEPVGDDFPAKARFAMKPDAPDDVALTDSLYNLDMLIVASEKLRALIEASQAPAVEYLPVPIYNHKKRRVKESYSIIHPIEPVDCLDVDACEAQWGRINKQAISRVKRLVVDEKRIPAQRLLFRPKFFANVILVHRSLAQAVDDAGCTGVRWVEIDKYPKA